MLSAEDVAAYEKGWPSPMRTDDEVNQGWRAMRVAGARSAFAKRVGLLPEDVTIVVSKKTGRGFFQWRHAVP